MNDEFADRVTEVLARLEPGDVTTYGEVAAEAGRPGAARAVGRILSESHGQYPWWRVVNAAGRLVPGAEIEQKKRLLTEGVQVEGDRVARMRQR
jgi:methylated-DNA-protein-cysteine methyltransferase-like protein